jgi:hypothetical protein
LPTALRRFGLPLQTYAYHADGTLHRAYDPLGRATTWINYKRGLAQNITHRDGAQESAAINNLGKPDRHTNAAGFTLAASAVRGERRLIAVVLGGPSRLGRDNNMQELLNIGFDVLESRQRGLPFTVASRFAEPDDLPDAVMDSLAGEVVAMDGAVEQPTRAVQAVDVTSAITALGDTGVNSATLASVRSGGGGRSRN